MGGDSPPHVLFEAVIQYITQMGDAASLMVFATHEVIEGLRTNHAHAVRAVNFVTCSQVIGMDENPISAVREKGNSSLVQGIDSLKEGLVDAFVSPGNTGALIVASKLKLQMLPSIRRPALLATLPTKKGTVSVVDVGGNVACKAQHLLQFALMGAAFQRCAHDNPTPRVGLLNIGVESLKGTPELRKAYQELQQIQEKHSINFVGNIEARELFKGEVDVLVTDGFSGNVLLKTAEGVSEFIFESLHHRFRGQFSEEMHHQLNSFQRHFDYAEYPGALVCGVDGVVIKCHGSSSVLSLLNGIMGASTLYEKEFLKKLKEELVVNTDS